MSEFQGFLDLLGVEKPSDDLINTCVRCGLCLQSCPTYTELGREPSSPRGRIALMRGVAEGRIEVDAPSFVHQMEECLGCLACQAACPSGVQYGHLLEAARAQTKAAQPTSAGVKFMERLIFEGLFMDMRLFRLFARSLWLYQRTGLQWLARRSGILNLLQLATAEQLLPRINDRFLAPTGQQFLPHATSDIIADPAALPFKRVALLTGCVQSVAFTQVHEATIRVLQVNGCEVVIPPGQGCCGALHQHGGAVALAQQVARQNIEALEAVNPSYIVVNAAGCSHHLKEYAHLLRDDPDYADRAKRLVAKTRDITELLAELGPKPPRQPLPWRVTYQEPCHLAHGQKISQPPRKVLQAIPGLELWEMTESAMCCGSAGTYNITQPVMAQQLLDRKMTHALATQAEVIASANTGCMLQLQVGLKQRQAEVKVMHIVEILDAAYQQE